jgi:predicted site-specific integrase-resolvase
MTKFVSASVIQKDYQVHAATLRRWSEKQKIEFVTTPGGHRLYNKHDVATIMHNRSSVQCSEQPQKKKICYARVSSHKQKVDLERQIDDLKQAYPEHEIISDIGSGLNFKRPGFLSLLDQCDEGIVSEVVCTHKDRLCRFASELVFHIFRRNQIKFVVSSANASVPDDSEFAEDVLAIITVFAARQHGRRSAANKRKRRETESESMPENQTTANDSSEATLETGICSSSMDVQSSCSSTASRKTQQKRVKTQICE